MHELLDIFCACEKPSVLAVIIGQAGSAYRPLGAMMGVYPDGRYVGHVSSGCIEADILLRAANLSEPQVLKYGVGSPFIDLTLPCGGGMEVLLVPLGDTAVLKQASDQLTKRIPLSIKINVLSGLFGESDEKETVRKGDEFHWKFNPALRFAIFGNGHEAASFAELVNGTNSPLKLSSTTSSTLERSGLSTENTHLLQSPKISDISEIDQWTSVTLFFHDHDLEQQILIDALETPAFYIGAQGSMTSHQARLKSLEQSGIAPKKAARIRGPIGLIPKVRDPKTLAISVLAEIHAVALEGEL